MASGVLREFRHVYDSNANTGQVQYQTVNGNWVNVDIVWKYTYVRGRTYVINDGTCGGALAQRTNALISQQLYVIDTITLPSTEPDGSRKQFKFKYNSDAEFDPQGVSLQWQPTCTTTAPLTSFSR